MPISNTATCPICRIEGRTPKMGYEYDASLDLPGTIHTYDVIISKKEFLCKTCNLKFSSYDL